MSGAWPCFGAFSPREDCEEALVRVGFIPKLGVGPSCPEISRPGKYPGLAPSAFLSVVFEIFFLCSPSCKKCGLIDYLQGFGTHLTVLGIEDNLIK